MVPRTLSPYLMILVAMKRPKWNLEMTTMKTQKTRTLKTMTEPGELSLESFFRNRFFF